MTSDPIRIGVAGLGRAFVLMQSAFRADPRVRLVAAAAPRAESRAAFEAEYNGAAYDSVQAMCADPEVDVVYIATPHEMHREHVEIAAFHGKHILVDKPLAVTLEDGAAMVHAAEAARVQMIVGPSHSFDAPVHMAREIIKSGEFGALRMVQAFNYTDFLYRPRRPEELVTEAGGGVLFSQAVHQIDMVRLLAGGMARQVSAMTGNWDPLRATEGAYSALIGFTDGVFASLTYSGYAHFDSDIWMGNVGELGHEKPPGGYGAARRALGKVVDAKSEAALKSTRTYGSTSSVSTPDQHEHFGPVIAMLDRADLRLTPGGVEVFGDETRSFRDAAGAERPRHGVLNALVNAVRNGRAPAQTGRWGLASLEVCHAILGSAQSGTATVNLQHQVAADQAGTFA